MIQFMEIKHTSAVFSCMVDEQKIKIFLSHYRLPLFYTENIQHQWKCDITQIVRFFFLHNFIVLGVKIRGAINTRFGCSTWCTSFCATSRGVEELATVCCSFFISTLVCNDLYVRKVLFIPRLSTSLPWTFLSDCF